MNNNNNKKGTGHLGPTIKLLAIIIKRYKYTCNGKIAGKKKLVNSHYIFCNLSFQFPILMDRFTLWLALLFS